MRNATLMGRRRVAYDARMWWQMFWLAAWWTAAATAIFVAVKLWTELSGVFRIEDLYTLYFYQFLVGFAVANALPGALLGLGSVAVLFAVYALVGRRFSRDRHLRGAEICTSRQLERRIQSWPRRFHRALVPGADGCRIAGLSFPPGAETQHTIVTGTTGSGKTVLISDLVDRIRERGERCIVYDKMGSYTRSFFDPSRDILLNPLDVRSPRWSPFLEARDPRDFDMMAAALIPQQKDTVDPFWVTAARQLFANGASVLWRRNVTANRTLVDHLLKTDLTALAKAMEGTVAQSIVDPDNPKTALSVRAMLTANLGPFEILPDEGPPFSIRDWVARRDGGGFLFLTSRGDRHASLRGIISTWLEIAVNALLSLDRDDGRRIWVILDELPTLHQLPSLQPGLAESRQFGGCFVLGIQVASALRDIYGRNGAETVSGLCGTRVVLASPDADTAQWSAESLGRSEIENLTENRNFAAGNLQDSVSVAPRREQRPLVMPAEIQRLRNLDGFLKFPGPYPVARIRLRHVTRPRVAEHFLERPPPPGAGPEPDRRKDASVPPLQGELSLIPPEPGDSGIDGKSPGGVAI